MRRLGITYPVALDNDYATWNAFQNQYWPAKYLIDRRGHLRYYHFGEGSYDETEARIRTLLGENAEMLPVANRALRPDADRTPLTPEIVPRLRAARALRSSKHGRRPTPFATTASRHGDLQQDELAYDGRWRVGAPADRRGPGRPAPAPLHRPEACYLVLGGNGNGRGDASTGSRVGSFRVHGSRLYTLARLPSCRRGCSSCSFDPGVRGYAFTFG